jgi:peptidoglycan/xylan/chitin deacetylase (PgdA/CDA1 family)
MMVARIFGDQSVYVPDDFGVWVTGENVYSVIGETFTTKEDPSPELHTKELPVLMYHHLTETGGSSAVISAACFDAHMGALQAAGYTPITLEQACDYAILGIDLPELPVLITFDDGYMGNYTYAFPILQRYGFNAAIFVIGTSFGKNTYKDTGEPITSHFGHDEAMEMVRSGLISIQSHSYDLHNVERFDDPFRQGVLRMTGESEQDYINAFRNDCLLMQELLKDEGEVFAFTYPYGKIDILSAILLHEAGIRITFSIEPGMNTLIKGLPQSLLELKRFNMTDEISGEDLLKMISY